MSECTSEFLQKITHSPHFKDDPESVELIGKVIDKVRVIDIDTFKIVLDKNPSPSLVMKMIGKMGPLSEEGCKELALLLLPYPEEVMVALIDRAIELNPKIDLRESMYYLLCGRVLQSDAIDTKPNFSIVTMGRDVPIYSEALIEKCLLHSTQLERRSIEAIMQLELSDPLVQTALEKSPSYRDERIVQLLSVANNSSPEIKKWVIQKALKEWDLAGTASMISDPAQYSVLKFILSMNDVTLLQEYFARRGGVGQEDPIQDCYLATEEHCGEEVLSFLRSRLPRESMGMTNGLLSLVQTSTAGRFLTRNIRYITNTQT